MVTKRQKKNAMRSNKQFAGIAKPKKNKKRNAKTPDYVLKGEIPDYMKWNASHPFQGGSVTPN